MAKVARESKNLFDYTANNPDNGFLDGQFINNNGTALTPSETGMPSNTSEYIPINPDTAYCVSGVPTAGYNSPSVCWYDSSKEYIAGQRYQNRGYVSFTSPSNAGYMRISYPVDYAAQVMANEGTAIPYEPYGATIWEYRVPRVLVNGEWREQQERIRKNDEWTTPNVPLSTLQAPLSFTPIDEDTEDTEDTEEGGEDYELER